ncbi:hypothetical protein A8924_0890 [Saccharopolyspora erythraea NRRL 2338]|uniref:Uncharacterized protein n=4 Tax=Saccharopolyspora erythraea TaxID=1836 RepID=A4F715_SACEN|nr:hypothetical protein A8924_0890 [Saccharopolyspora erythraea NRRL 2338]CAL99839.1 hypothetical protein SACE_0491 [Saccharopolyspora erythraea NRRL 2338]
MQPPPGEQHPVHQQPGPGPQPGPSQQQPGPGPQQPGPAQQPGHGQQPPAKPAQKPAPRPPKPAARADGGFGPIGSGGWQQSSRGSNYDRSPTKWGAEEVKDEYRDAEYRAPRQGETGDAPQFLIEADDLYDEDYGESRLVAPPVLGEAPSSYRDF